MSDPITETTDTPTYEQSQLHVAFRDVGQLEQALITLGSEPGILIFFVEDQDNPDLVHVNMDVTGFEREQLAFFFEDMASQLKGEPSDHRMGHL